MLLRNIIKPLPSCREVTGIRGKNVWTALARHAAGHPGTPPMNERDYVKVFIERRYNRRGAGTCC
jgi:Selenoprotein, putative